MDIQEALISARWYYYACLFIIMIHYLCVLEQAPSPGDPEQDKCFRRWTLTPLKAAKKPHFLPPDLFFWDASQSNAITYFIGFSKVSEFVFTQTGSFFKLCKQVKLSYKAQGHTDMQLCVGDIKHHA